MRIAFLTRYSPRGASSRYRTWQYLPGLEREGFTCEALPLLGDDYLEARYRGRRPPAVLLRAAFERLRARPRWRAADLIVLEKELFPYVPAWLEKVLLGRGYALDFDDALQHIYDRHPIPLVRALLGRKFQRLARRARLVTVGNPYLEAAFADATGQATRVERLPTVLDTTRYPVSPPPEGPFTIGWIGTPVSARNLVLLEQPLRRFFQRHAGRLLLIGAEAEPPLAGLPVERVPWSEANEAEELSRIHVGVMPLFDRPLERGKSGLKLLQYLACGRPVIASPVGVNRDIVRPEVGFLAEDGEMWLDRLERLIEDPDLRARLGANGRARVESDYSLAAWTPRYAQFLRRAAAPPT